MSLLILFDSKQWNEKEMIELIDGEIKRLNRSYNIRKI